MLGVLRVVLGPAHHQDTLLGELQLFLTHTGQRGAEGGEHPQHKPTLYGEIDRVRQSFTKIAFTHTSFLAKI